MHAAERSFKRKKDKKRTSGCAPRKTPAITKPYVARVS